jgi:IS6 family transposase
MLCVLVDFLWPQSVDAWFSAERDAAAAVQFFQKVLQASGHPRPRVIPVRWQPVLPERNRGTEAGAETGVAMPLSNLPVLKQCCEQDHRGIKRWVNASQGFRSFDGAWQTIQGYEVLHRIRKGQVRWLPRGISLRGFQFIREILGLKAE